MKRLFFTAVAETQPSANVLIIGIPFEGKVNSREGADAGPAAIRSASHYIESFSMRSQRDLLDIGIRDGGDIEIRADATPEQSMDQIAFSVSQMLTAQARLVSLGGDHTITLPLVRAISDFHPDLALVHFDAHFDAQDVFENARYTYASWVHRIRDEFPDMTVFQIGMRTATKDEFLHLAALPNSFPFSENFESAVSRVSAALGSRPVYVTFDIDILDPSFAPGTGNPESGGVSPVMIFSAITKLRANNVVAFDVVEVSPRLDPSERTAILAAEIIREGILAWWS